MTSKFSSPRWPLPTRPIIPWLRAFGSTPKGGSPKAICPRQTTFGSLAAEV